MKTRDEILDKLQEIFEEMFEIDPSDVTLDAHLYNDLDIDSIDAIDLMVTLKNLTGKKINPDDFKSVRTVEDVAKAVEKLIQDQ